MSKLYRLRFLFWALLLLISVWFGYRLTRTDTAASLTSFSLDSFHLLGLIAFNAGSLFIFNLRWWLILHAQGLGVPYLATLQYRLAAFSISYFTPLPQFGGEPLQIFALHRRHALPTSKAVASVTLDKLFELLSNFSFLVIGSGLLLHRRIGMEFHADGPALLVVGLALLPVSYLAIIAAGRNPLLSIIHRVDRLLGKRVHSLDWWSKAMRIAGSAEQQMADLIRQRPLLILQMLAASLLVWLASLFEYWLAMRVLGVSLTAEQTVLALAAARLAFLTPLPGGIGALEASQMLAMRALGLDPLIGVAISLWIRGRDLMLGAIGAACSTVLVDSKSSNAAPAPAGD